MTNQERIHLGGVSFHPLREAEIAERVVDAAADGHGGWICTVNLDILRQNAASPDVRALVTDADFVVPDGMPIVWASRLAGTPLPERVAGSSLIHSVPARAAQRGLRVFLIGGNEGAAAGAAERLAAAYPGLKIAGTLCPPLGFERDPARVADLLRAVADARPHIVFVGLGFPKQERLIQALRRAHPDAWYLPCGISLSFVSGEIRRAPPVVQRAGLEWLHRLAQEPRRLASRYLLADPPALLRLMLDALRTRWTRRHDAA